MCLNEMAERVPQEFKKIFTSIMSALIVSQCQNLSNLEHMNSVLVAQLVPFLHNNFALPRKRNNNND